MIAIGGTGMAPLACLLDRLGHRVRGSDGPLYPPMSTLLADAGITPRVGFEPAHLEPPPDLVIVGNAVPRHNPQARATEERELPRMSMPEALGRFFLAGRRPLVVAGTHGKTTTTACASWVLTACGADPGYLIGGVPIGADHSFRLGSGERFVIEGDEYNASYFDRGPKFLHYRPHALILTSVEWDHADLYPEPERLLAAYRSLVELVPEDGLIVACGDHPELVELVHGAAKAPVVTYGLEPHNEVCPRDGIRADTAGSHFVIDDADGPVSIDLPVSGRHNVQNALAVWAVARHDGHAAVDVAAALSSFRGVKRRLEVLGEVDGVTVIDDFAHHPTAVGVTLAALADRYPGRRRIALFEPRSLTAGRAFFFEAYREAFARADVVLMAPIFHAGRLSDDERLDREALVGALVAAGVNAEACESNDLLLERALTHARGGDVVVTMSSGSFEGMPRRVLEALGGRESGES
ncbi:MAG: Mur ligase family protein [Acidobacteriota bacterium]